MDASGIILFLLLIVGIYWTAKVVGEWLSR